MSSPAAEARDRLERAALLALALGLAALLAVPTVDPIAHWVLHLVGQIPAGDWWRPFEAPPPAFGRGFRPLSVLGVQLFIAAFGPQAAAPPWLIFAKAALSLFAFGALARAWLRRLGAGPAAAPIAALGVISGPQLFSAAGLTELDGLGAALTLGLSVLLLGGPLGRGRLLGAAALLLAVLTLKESSAIIGIGVVVVHLVELWREGRRAEGRSLARVAGAVVGLWAVGAASLVLEQAPGLHEAGVDLPLRLRVLAYSLSQLLVLMPAPGAALLWAAALAPRLGPWGRAAALALPLLALILSPVLGEINHYEAIYTASEPWMLGGGLLLLAPLGLGRARRGAGLLPLGFVLAPLGVLVPAVLLAQSLREDLAARLFLLVHPALWLLAWGAAQRLWGLAGPGAAGRALRALVLLFGLLAVWSPIAGGINGLLMFRARAPLERAGVEAVAGLPLTDAVLLFDDFSHYPEPAALLPALGGGPLPSGLVVHYVPTQLQAPELPAGRFSQFTDPEAALAAGRPVHLLSLRRRSPLPPGARAALQGDFSWLRHPLGVFVPLAAPGRSGALPPLTPLEDGQAAVYGPDPLPLDALGARRGRAHLQERRALWLLPPHLWAVPQRLWVGAGLLEPMELRLQVLSFSAAPP